MGKGFVVPLSARSVSNVKKVWKTVNPVFASYDLTCDIREGGGISMETGDTVDRVIIQRAVVALLVLAAGRTPKWVEPILLGQIYSEMIDIKIPDGMSEQDFSSNYGEFMKKFDYEYELHNKFFCYVVYMRQHIIAMAPWSQGTNAVKSIVQDSLLGTIPFEVKAKELTSEIENYYQNHGIPTETQYIEKFCSLIALGDDAICEYPGGIEKFCSLIALGDDVICEYPGGECENEHGLGGNSLCENEETHKMVDLQNSRLKALRV